MDKIDCCDHGSWSITKSVALESKPETLVWKCVPGRGRVSKSASFHISVRLLYIRTASYRTLGMLKSLHSLGSCVENFLLINISSILSVIFTRLWLKCQRMFRWPSCTSARHAGSFDCLMTCLILITMDNGRGHCAYWQSCKVQKKKKK